MSESLRERFIPLVLGCMSCGLAGLAPGAAHGAENLPPLRVAPGLLGATPRKAPPPPTPPPAADAGAADTTPGLKLSPLATPPAVEPRSAEPAPEVRPLQAPEKRPAPPPEALAPPPHPAPVPVASPATVATGGGGATIIEADRVSGVTDVEILAEGNARLQSQDRAVSADRLRYSYPDDEVDASGNVRLTRGSDLVSGPKLRIKLEESVGFMDSPEYLIRREPTTGASRKATTGSGAAERVEFLGVNHYRMSKATYSTCAPGRHDWYAEVGELDLDFDREVGVARNAKLVFKGVPLLYTPWVDFALNNRRKSGVLPPTVGASSRTGTEVAVPYYWNIAPNRDATLTPRLMSRRGVMLGGEFRYLEPDYAGVLRGEWLTRDSVTGESRNSYAIEHAQSFTSRLSGQINLNGVSDPTYFTDLSSQITATSQQLLLRQGSLRYEGDWWNAQVVAQSYQALVAPLLPLVAEPYERLPQMLVRANRHDLKGLAFAFTGEFVNFKHSSAVNARRVMLYPQLSLPLQSAAFYLTPKLGVHATRYELTRQAAGVPASQSRNLPIASVDAGVVFERETQWLERPMAHTLEPRLYYLYVPFRDQDAIPRFDTALADFNIAQIFSENSFAGHDRIADANQVTAAVTSRLIDEGSGAEVLRAMLGQRYYFRDQRVTLIPGAAARTHRSSDILAALAGRVVPAVFADAALQYNPNDSRLERIVLGGRYQPAPFKVLNLGYRFQKNVLREVDLSGQWPLAPQWYGVGRYNYSLHDKRLVEAVGGLEYDGGCWIVRGVFQRFAAATQTASTAFFIQLELNDFAKVGSNPLEILKRSIPGYGRINRSVADPVFGID